jgi:hypothetical protein
MNEEKRSENKPPYVAYKTFQNFIGSLRASGVPDRIDRTVPVLSGLSGGTQSFLLAALRFLGFINTAGVPSADFVKLVKEPETEKAILIKATKANYHFIFGSDFNVESATEGQLLDKFRAYDLGGDTVRKCLSFFVLLCNSAGMKLSPHVKGVRGAGAGSGSGGTRRPYRKHKTIENETPVAHQPPERNTVQELLLQKFPNFDPKWDAETAKKWFDSFEKFMKAASPQGEAK